MRKRKSGGWLANPPTPTHPTPPSFWNQHHPFFSPVVWHCIENLYRVVGSRGLSNHFCDTRESPPLYGENSRWAALFVTYHRSGFHFPQPCSTVNWGFGGFKHCFGSQASPTPAKQWPVPRSYSSVPRACPSACPCVV